MLSLRSLSTHKPHWLTGFATVALSSLLVGCEMDSYMDPSTVARRIESTPVQLPILDRLAVIEPTEESAATPSDPIPDDLKPTRSEYALTLGDIVQVSIFELIYPTQYSTFEERIDETGAIRLPVVDRVEAAGLTASQLEERIANVLAEKQILFDALVSIDVLASQQNTFTVIGQPGQGSTRFGVYNIPRPDFRILEAIAMAGGIQGTTKNLLIIRPTPLSPPEGTSDNETATTGASTESVDPLDLLNDAVSSPTTPQGATQSIMNDAIDAGQRPEWVYINGKWERTTTPAETQAAAAGDDLSNYMTQRIIRIPYQKLVAGETKYNVVIRPGDIVRVPDQTAGFVYTLGFVSRPGTYSVPGENELTVTNLIAAAGGFSGLAIPERAEIRRRVGENREAIVRIDLKAIFDGTAPNFYLKPNDEITVGTNFWATPLAIVRNGFRFTYGFGFVADRNFGPDLFFRY